MRNKTHRMPLARHKGVATLELALLFPLIFTLGLAMVILIIYLQSSIVTQYAAFAAARSFQVYGDKTLGEIGYHHVSAAPATEKNQSIAEAAAEKVIFESLLWEQNRIRVAEGTDLFARTYEDGVQQSYDGLTKGSKPGAVTVNFLGCQGPGQCDQGLGVRVTYCMPLVFPGAAKLFGDAQKRWPCQGKHLGREYQGVAISAMSPLKRMPVTP